jgi:two-component system cell cycle sensor histidine kinase/response regulator CckA
VSETALAPDTITRAARKLAPGSIYLASLGVVAIGGAFASPDPRLGIGFMILGITLLWIVLIVRVLVQRYTRSRSRVHETIAGFIAYDAAPAFTTNGDGMIGYQNQAATEEFGGVGGRSLLTALGEVFASPGATLQRLQTRAKSHGAAREDAVTRSGHVRLSVHQIGDDGYLWRLESLSEQNLDRGADAIALPMMAVSKSGTVLHMNEALRTLLGGREGALDRIVNDLPLRPGDIHEISAKDGKMRCQITEVISAAGRRELYFMPQKSARAGDWELLDALPVPLLKMDAAGNVQLANRPARDLLATPEVSGIEFADLVEGLGRSVTDWLMEAAEGRTVLKPEIVRATRPMGETFLQITLNRVIEGDEVALIAVLNDATELKTLEAQFVQSQKMQAIGQLAGGVAHDFNNLLTAISGHCDLLLLRHDKGDPDFGDLVQIHQNANRAASLVGQLLAFSRKQTLKPEVVDLRDALSDLTHLLNRLVGEKVRLALDHDPSLHMIRADKRQIEQVIMNLVVNARDAMPEGGEISIETRNEDLTNPYERDRVAVPPGKYVVVKVTDKGSGIPADKLQKVFEPFFTTKRTGEGTGLGLSTAYGIVKQTGGFIFVDSIVGQGTSFTLFLPAHDKVISKEAPKALPAAAKQQSHESGVILLVEDEAPVRAFASRALRMRGYTVIEAENAEEALNTLEDESLKVDVFVTDVIMPGLDGPSWVSLALEKRPGVKVVFVSGYAEESFAEQQARIPNSVFLPKPFSLSELTATVQEQIH